MQPEHEKEMLLWRSLKALEGPTFLVRLSYSSIFQYLITVMSSVALDRAFHHTVLLV